MENPHSETQPETCHCFRHGYVAGFSDGTAAPESRRNSVHPLVLLLVVIFILGLFDLATRDKPRANGGRFDG